MQIVVFLHLIKSNKLKLKGLHIDNSFLLSVIFISHFEFEFELKKRKEKKRENISVLKATKQDISSNQLKNTRKSNIHCC